MDTTVAVEISVPEGLSVEMVRAAAWELLAASGFAVACPCCAGKSLAS